MCFIFNENWNTEFQLWPKQEKSLFCHTWETKLKAGTFEGSAILIHFTLHPFVHQCSTAFHELFSAQKLKKVDPIIILSLKNDLVTGKKLFY